MSRKAEEFYQGIEFFIIEVCRRSRDNYTLLMHGHEGYVIAAKKYYEVSGRMRKEERDPLFDNDILPQFVIDVYRDLELKHFNIDLVTHR